MNCGRLETALGAFNIAFNTFSEGVIDVVDITSLENFLDTVLTRIEEEFPENAPIELIKEGILDLTDSMFTDIPAYSTVKILEYIDSHWKPNSEIISTQDIKNSHSANGGEDFKDLDTIGIERFYSNIKHREDFRKFFQNSIIRNAFINPAGTKLILNNGDLNLSIKEYKNELARDLANYLESDVTSIYDEYGQLDKYSYNKLMQEGLMAFENKNYSNDTNPNIRRNFNRFYILNNFDSLVNKYSNGVLKVEKSYEGSIEEPSNGIKYYYDGKLNVKKEFEEDMADIFDHTNEAVKLFIESIPRTLLGDSHLETDDYIKMNDFNRVMSIIMNKGADIMLDMRRNPEETLYNVLKEAEQDTISYFAGQSHLISTFNDISKALLNLYNLSKDNPTDLISMIANNVNKLTEIDYQEYIFNNELREYEVRKLDPTEVSSKKSNFERSLSQYGKLENFTDLFNEFKVKVNLENKSIDLITPKRKYTLSLDDGKITKYSLETLLSDPDLLRFIYEVTDRNVDQDVLRLIYSNETSSRANTILNVVSNIIVNDLFAKELGGDNYNTSSQRTAEHRTIIQKNLEDIIVGKRDKSKLSEATYYDYNLGTLKVGGFNNGGTGLGVMTKALALLKGEDVKSFVRDASKNSLPVHRLPNTINNDQYLFKDLEDLVSKQVKSIGDFNLFTAEGLSETRGRTKLKTKISTQNGVVKSVSDLNTSDLIYSQFIFDYLGQEQNNEYGFQPATYSDKSQIWIKTLKTNIPIEFKTLDGKIINIKSLEAATAREIAELHYETMRGMLSRLEDNLLNDYQTLFRELREQGHSNFLHPENYSDALKILESGLNADLIYDAVLGLQKKGIEIQIHPEIHHVRGSKRNELLEGMMKIYKDQNLYNQKMKMEQKMYAYLLKKNNVRFYTKFNDGRENTYLTKKINKIKSLKTDLNLSDVDIKLLENKIGKIGKNKTFGEIWINRQTEELIPYYIFKNGKLDLEADIDVVKSDPRYSVVMNPMMEKFFYAHNLVTDNYNAATVGLPFIHKTKGTISNYVKQLMADKDAAIKKGDIELAESIDTSYLAAFKLEESGRTIASSKRAVIFGATIHPFMQNKFNGVPGDYKMAVVNDPSTNLFNLQGNQHSQEQFDGSVFANPFVAQWEANSLPELALSPVHRKSIGMFSLSQYLGSGLGKWATFTLTNEFMLNSYNRNLDTGEDTMMFDGQKMMKKMTDHAWTIPNLDITNGGKIHYNGYYYDLDKGTNIKINSITKVGSEFVKGGIDPITGITTQDKWNNQYRISKTEVDENGKPSDFHAADLVTINSNYDLWMALGGQYSKGFDPKLSVNRTLQYNFGNSISKVAEVASELAFRNNNLEPLIEEIRAADVNYYNKVLEGLNKVEKVNGDVLFKSQKYYYQPMKHSDIHYVANSSSVKNGAANINPASVYNDSSKDLIYYKIKTDFLGIQLNADHDVDNSEVSEMSQVISAAEENGTTHEWANMMYTEIGRAITENLKDYTQYLDADDQIGLYKVLGKYLVKMFASGSKDNISLANTYVELVRQELSKPNYSEMKRKIPFDDPNFWGAFANGFTNDINKTAIKRAYSGIGAILNPSQDFITVYEDPTTGEVYKKVDLMEGKNLPEHLSKLNFKERLKAFDIEVPIGKIDVGDFIEFEGNTYLVQGYDEPFEKIKNINGVDTIVRSGKVGLNIIKNLRNTQSTIKKLGSRGRNLKNLNHKFQLENSNIIGGHLDFDIYDLDTSLLAHQFDKLAKAYKSMQTDKNFELTDDLFNLQAIFNEVDDRVKKKYKGKDKLNLEDKTHSLNLIRSIIQDDLDILEKENKFLIPYNLRINPEIKYANVIEGSKEYNPYEMMLGAVWASKFDLKVGDSVQDIVNRGQDFFMERIIESLKTPIEDHDMYLTRSNRDHLHIIVNNNSNADKIAKLKALNKIKELPIFSETSGNIDYRVIDGKQAYPITEGMKFYKITAETGDSRDLVIVDTIEDVQDLISSRFFNTLEINENIFKAGLNETGEFILRIQSKSDFNDDIVKQDAEKALVNGEDYLNYVQNMSLNNFYNIQQLAQIKATSFNQSLDFIVARIPAQSMQSYMNMRIAGFIDTPTNIIYVPAMQLYLQGSDFDIDKAYVLGAGVSEEGQYYSWSPLFNYSSETHLKNSNNLPIPNNITYLGDIEKGIPFNYSELAHLNRRNVRKEFDNNPELINKFAKLMTEIQDQSSQLLNLPKDLIELVNYHTKFKMKPEAKIEAIKNKVYHLLRISGENVRNFIAQTNPISMEIFQTAADNSSSGKDSQIVSNSNPASIMMMQDQNAVGKGVIGISANGAKVAAALLNYYNESLSKATKAIGSKQKIHYSNKLFFNPLNYNISLDGTADTLKAGLTMPNVNFGNYNIDAADMKVVKDLANSVQSMGFQEDIFLPLSALISSATDNAKELILEKVNAGMDLAGVYIHLILIGEDLEKIAKYMTTPSISLVQKRARQSVFNDFLQNSSLNQAISYYLDGVSTVHTQMVPIMRSIDSYIESIYKKDEGIKQVAEKLLAEINTTSNTTNELHKNVLKRNKFSINSIDKLLGGVPANKKVLDLQKQLTNMIRNYFVNDKNKTFLESKRMGRMSEDEMMQYAEAQEILFEAMSDGDISMPKNKENRFIFFRYLEEVSNRLNEISDLEVNDFVNIATLKQLKVDSREVTTLARFLSVNQGIPTKQLDKYNLRLGIEAYINGKYSEHNIEGERFNLVKFTQDENYAQEQIEMYNKSKVMFNILDVVYNSPHFFQMWKAYNVNVNSLNAVTIKNKYAEILVKRLKDDGIIVTSQIQPADITKVNGFLQENLINKILTHRLRVPITIESTDLNSRYTDRGLTKFEGNYELNFGSQYDRATFKFWMENFLIPKLKRENTTNNRFIKDLTLTVFADIGTGNKNPLYVLPINMRLGKPSEQTFFNDYLDQFTQIKNNEIIPGYTIEDVFFLYNLLVNKNQFSEYSLTKIFENSITDYLDPDNMKSDSLLLKFFEAEHDAVFQEEFQFTEKDFDYDDLKLRYVKNEKINNNVFYRGYDKGERVIFDNKDRVVHIFKTDNTINLPKLLGTAKYKFSETREKIINQLRNLIDSGEADIKLTCD